MTVGDSGSWSIAEALNRLIDDYKERTGQPKLSIRALTRQMRSDGVTISHGTLQNLVNGTHGNPGRELQNSLARFFGVSPVYFDAPPTSLEVEVMGRFADLSPERQEAVLQLINDLHAEEHPPGETGDHRPR
ncbi:XRE family transcriptional regulator [Actinoalloteichus sp. AHMU CJ021]|nr:helix-turn-helix transcriptional regulator [Actinoalloteichus caeruleus]AUS80378.1 XRE family transcriptional regulator [Actinoalloteichus sp. AHMU CJ021]